MQPNRGSHDAVAVIIDPMQKRLFSDHFDDEFPVGVEGHRAYIGRNVLRGLIGGIDDFIETRPRRSSSNDRGPVLIGCAPWMDDPELAMRLKQLASVCVVITKQGHTKWDLRKLGSLHDLNAATRGLPLDAFPDLAELAPRIDDSPFVVGPYERVGNLVLPSVRTLGFCRQAKTELVPLAHAKLALLGELWWHDEDALGHVADVTGFTPHRLWVSSANFTRSSRASLEIGYWTEEPSLLEGTERFLLKLVAFSEGLDGADEPTPQLLPVEYDDEAMRDALAELDWGEDEGDE